MGRERGGAAAGEGVPQGAAAPGASPAAGDSSRLLRAFSRGLLVASLGWTAVCVGSLAYHLAGARRQVETLARHEAAESISKDLVYRFWAAGHGGVYVPVSPTTPPNPHLAGIPERDLVTPSGRRLTLVNPAYMTRQVHELGRSRGVWGHLTSARPIRPENGPDAWELQALAAFERGEAEYGGVVEAGGEPHYRLMRPLRTEEPCLKCHGAHGSRLGDLRGGISVAIPMAAFAGIAREHMAAEALHFGAVWALGIAGLLLAAPYVRRRIVERESAAAALARSLEFTRSILDNEPECVKTLGPGGTLTYMNPAGLAMIEAERLEQVAGRPVSALIEPEHREAFEALTRRVFAGESGSLVFVMRGLRGTLRWLETRAVPLRGASGGVEAVLGLTRDVTASRRAEERRATLESQLRQAQKLESVGRLAGGVAHDFNNMLQTILGCVYLALPKAPPAGDLREKLLEIQKAAERSADLTRQLLMFARKQVGAPRPLDLNAAIAGMLQMLRRLIGEQIEVEWVPAPGLWPVLLDPTQVDQVMANLCVNARDAIGGAGRIRIETRNAPLDGAACSGHPGCAAGDYVRLSVSDSGRGIAAEDLAHIFDPFFTTKGVGEGTGLGLAIVHGIVTQAGGFLEVASRAGSGTTFTIHVPRLREGGVPPPAPTAPAAPPGEAVPDGGRETVLLVEDEVSVRTVAAELLREFGYAVLVAETPGDAVRLAGSHAGEIDLLLTDVVMPGMDGPALAARVRELRPRARLLFMSGYDAGALAAAAGPPGEAPLLRKPFTAAQLAAKVREALGDAAHGGRAGAR